MGSRGGGGGGGWSGGEDRDTGIASSSGRDDTDDDGLSKYLSGSRDQSYGIVVRKHIGVCEFH